MDIQEKIIVIIGLTLLGIGCILALIVFISLMKIRYKDITVYLRIYLEILDFFFCISIFIVFCIFYLKENPYSEFVVHGAFISHELWLLYMCFALYKTFYLKKATKPKSIHLAFLMIILLGFTYSLICAIISIVYNTTLEFILLAVPTFLSFFFIIYFYCHIKKAIDNDLKNVENREHPKIKATKRIYGYIIIFLIFVIETSLYFAKDKYASILLVCTIINSFYPIANSIYYGMSKSTLQSLKYLFIKNEEFLENGEMVNILREEGVIFPRFYYDTIGFSENKILNIES